MEDYPKKLLFEACFLGDGIFLYPVNANIDFPFNRLALGAQFKSDDICIVIMFQEILVDLKEALIGTKNIIEAGQLYPFFPENCCNQSLYSRPVLQGYGGFKKEINGWFCC